MDNICFKENININNDDNMNNILISKLNNNIKYDKVSCAVNKISTTQTPPKSPPPAIPPRPNQYKKIEKLYENENKPPIPPRNNINKINSTIILNKSTIEKLDALTSTISTATTITTTPPQPIVKSKSPTPTNLSSTPLSPTQNSTVTSLPSLPPKPINTADNIIFTQPTTTITSNENTPTTTPPQSINNGWLSANAKSDHSYSNSPRRSLTLMDNLMVYSNSFPSGGVSSSLNNSNRNISSSGSSKNSYDTSSTSPTPTKYDMNSNCSLSNLAKSDEILFYGDGGDDDESKLSPSSSSKVSPVIRTRRQLVLQRKSATMKLVQNGEDHDSDDDNNERKSNTLTPPPTITTKGELSSPNRGHFTISQSSYNLRGCADEEDDDGNEPNGANNNSKFLRKSTNSDIFNKDDKSKLKHGRATSLTGTTTGDQQEPNSATSQFISPLRNLIPHGTLNLPPFPKRKTLFNKLDPKAIIIEKIEEQQLKFEKVPSRKSQLPSINQSTIFNKVITEMIETEADYLDDLEVIINLYLFASSEMVKQKILESSNIFSIFSNIEELYHISLKLYPMLLKTIPLLENNQYPNIEEIFLYNSNSMLRYGSYLSLHEQSNKFLQHILETNQTVAAIFQHCKLSTMGKLLDLNSFLIKPCQRLCKYPLLLRELKKAVPENDETHHRTFARSVSLMEKIVLGINGKITNDEKIQSIIKEIGTKEIEQLLHHQTWIKDTKIKRISKSGTHNDATIYLLNQRIIIIEKGTFIQKKLINIPLASISRVCDHEAKVANGFGIFHNYNANNIPGTTQPLDVVSLICDSKQEKLQWINEIEDAIQTQRVLTGTYLYTTSELQNPANEAQENPENTNHSKTTNGVAQISNQTNSNNPHQSQNKPGTNKFSFY